MSDAAALTPALVELRSALAAGAPPALALQDACRRHPDALAALAGAARDLAVGMSLDGAIPRLPADAGPAGLLLRALAVAERAGVGAVDAVAQAESAVTEELELSRLLRVRTAQARGSLRVLALAPPAVIGFFLLLQPEALGFYATPLGRASGLSAVALLLAARRWAAAIVAAVPAAARDADPLGDADGAAAEVAELLAVALRGGASPLGGVRLVAELGPPPARAALTRAESALAAGLPIDGAFAGTPLHALGGVLSAPVRWGAQAHEALRAYARGLRADRRAALAEAAERAQLRLVFPTTLLTLPSFLVAVVPPLLWTGLRR